MIEKIYMAYSNLQIAELAILTENTQIFETKKLLLGIKRIITKTSKKTLEIHGDNIVNIFYSILKLLVPIVYETKRASTLKE